MENNQKNALTYLLGGLGVVTVLGGVFNLYPIIYGLLGALILWITSSAIGKSWIAILCSVGIIVLLAGIFNLYTFAYGLLGAATIWIIAGSLKRYLGEDIIENHQH
ncbi:MAG: hypothetical protein HZC47_08600 [Methanobacterium sp.]|uniref:hypothetical protein n=1 Tax=Methanobacterium sp. TaxID=2164 RepID=UPI003D6559D0|nr:hypothetical protein [Methanobacterium sp.]